MNFEVRSENPERETTNEGSIKKIPWGREMMGSEEQSQRQGVQEEEEEEEEEEWLSAAMASMRCQ